MNRLPLLLLPLVLAIAVPLSADEDRPARLDSAARDEIEALIEKAFAATSASERRNALAALAEKDPVPAKEIAGFTKLCLSLARNGSKAESEGEWYQLGSGPTRGKYLLTGTGRGKKGIFIGLHGGGPGAGDARTAAQKWSSAAGKGLICVFPQATRLVHDAWNQEDQEKFVLEIIEEVKRTWTIDTNRVYVAGHSMGGYGSWSLGGKHADLFAGISPNSGGVYGTTMSNGAFNIEQGVLPNLYHVALKWFHGTDDPQCPIENDLEAERILIELKKKHPKGYEFDFKKIDGIGHGIAPEGLGPTIAWLAKKKRDPWPAKVIWEPSKSYKKHFYWLHMPMVSRGVLIVAQIEKKREIEIETTGFVPRLSLLLSDELVNAKREITVVWNGREKFRGRLEPSVATLAESALVRRDPEMVSTYRIDLEQ